MIYVFVTFFQKVLSPVIGYGADFTLLQFVYDLALWTGIGGKKNATRGIPFRLAMKGFSFTPMYWRTRHCAVVDLSMQCYDANRGSQLPSFFLTQSVYEKTFPYHEWIEREFETEGRRRQSLAGPETLHHAHVLTQLHKGFVTGFSGGTKKCPCTDHVYACRDGSQRQTCVASVLRLEFQDGKRKRPSMSDPERAPGEGRGTVHSHSLDTCDNIDAMRLETQVRATLPNPQEEPVLSAYIGFGECQNDWHGVSGWDVQEEATFYDPTLDRYCLQHTQADHSNGLRAYIPSIMEVIKGAHQDVQHHDGHGNLHKYVATYAPKMSSSFAEEFLSDEATDYSLTRKILTEYHPLEPEMWMHLAGGWLKPMRFSGTFVDFVAPLPNVAPPDTVKAYQACTWRGEDMNLLHFIRKSSKEGKIIQWVKVLYKASGNGDADSLEAFARTCPMRGEKIVAVEYHSRLNDKFFGEWMVVNIPFRRMEDLLAPEITEKVPEQLRYFACARYWKPDYWNDDSAIDADMQTEAHRQSTIDTFLARVRAHRAAVDRYLSGELSAADAGDAAALESLLDPAYGEEQFQDASGQRFRYHRKQLELRTEIRKQVQHSVDIEATKTDAEFDRLCAAAQSTHQPIVVVGPPGSGKTTVVDHEIARIVENGGRVLYMLPTGLQAVRMRLRHPHVDVDTVAAICGLHKDLNEVLHVFELYDAVFIDEFPQLSTALWDRVMALYEATRRRICLVACGDFAQLPSISGTNALDSSTWQGVKIIKLVRSYRCKDDVLRKKLDLLRSHAPSEKQVQDLCRGHKAWNTQEPTAWDLLQVFRSTDEKTTVATVTRRGAAIVNDLAVQVLFRDRHKQCLGTVPCDWEANLENYDDRGRPRTDRKPEPLGQDLFLGLRLHLTKNKDKGRGFVNGMEATVEDYDAHSGLIMVRTKLGKLLSVHPYTEEVFGEKLVHGEIRHTRIGNVCAYPFRAGYASTIYKLQGAELPHITAWLDAPNARGAAYVALSRVAYDKDYLLAGTLTSAHFYPTSWVCRVSDQSETTASGRPSRNATAIQEFRLPMRKQWERMVCAGAKTVEGRLYTGVAAHVEAGDRLILGNARTLVTEVRIYNNFAEFLADVGHQAAIPGSHNAAEALQEYYKFKGYKDMEDRCGVVGFFLQVL